MSAARRKPRRWIPRAEWLGAITGILALGLLAALAVLVVDQAQELRYERAARDALAQQVEDLGGTPVAGAPGSRGQPGEPGEKGEKGDKGEPGKPGKPAPTVTPSPGPSGASGRPGKDGADSTVPGPSGMPGADSTVPGPSGAPGEPGRDGVDGRDGIDGKDGEDGKPPASWTWTDRFGDTYTCQPIDDFDPDNPRYDCQRDEKDPGNGGSGGLLSAGLDPQRRQYA